MFKHHFKGKEVAIKVVSVSGEGGGLERYCYGLPSKYVGKLSYGEPSLSIM